MFQAIIAYKRLVALICPDTLPLDFSFPDGYRIVVSNAKQYLTDSFVQGFDFVEGKGGRERTLPSWIYTQNISYHKICALISPDYVDNTQICYLTNTQ